MRHRKAGKQLSRNSSHRRALLRNMVTSLFKHERIETTDAKAKSLRPVAEKMITLAKRGDLHARRQALAYIQDKAVTHKLFDELKDRFLDRQGGYIRIIKKNIRKGDGAPVSIVQLIPPDEEKKVAKKKPKKAKADKPQAIKPPKEAVVKEEIAPAVEQQENGKLDERNETAEGLQGETSQVTDNELTSEKEEQ